MKQKVSISLDFRIVSAVFLAALIAMLFLWKPWSSSVARTIDVTGDATRKSEPDSYQFSPMYQKKGTDRSAIQTELNNQINAIVAKLKELGVAEAEIALNSSTYDNYYNDGTQEVTSNSLTITTGDKDLAQKIQDYLITTSPEGQITPYATFSTAKRKTLDADMRIDAIKDAKAKAMATADELGLKLGKVVSISDPQSGGVMPMYATGTATMAVDSASPESLKLLSGKQELSYTVQIKYELK